MCGIFGLIGTPWRDGARAALDALRTRGPDDSALLDLGDVVLGHTRLAVIDHGQASVAENDIAQVQQRTVVGPTGAQRIERRPGAVTPRRAYQAEDSAHRLGMPGVLVSVVPSKQVFVVAGSEQSRSFPYVLSDQVETEGREQ